MWSIFNQWPGDGFSFICHLYTARVSHNDGVLSLSRFYPWDFPGKNTGVGCHFLFQGIFRTHGWNSHFLSWEAWATTREALYHAVARTLKKKQKTTTSRVRYSYLALQYFSAISQELIKTPSTSREPGIETLVLKRISPSSRECLCIPDGFTIRLFSVWSPS